MEKKLTSFDEDLLNRKSFAINLTNIVEKVDDIHVIAIDSSWGTGKSTFIRMWQDMLFTEEEYKDKYETLYFNAWENDYIKDPLAAFISEIEGQIKKDEAKVKKGLNYIRKNGKKLIKPVVKAGIKLITNGLLNLPDFKVDKNYEDKITELMGEIGEISIQEIVKEKEIRGQFINDLEKYIKENNIKIIFFIDELDRCRPSFAIELLEVIKHIFNVDNIKFIISVDREQLAYSISTLYGQGMDSDGYLRRFFDLEYKIPVIDKRKYIELKNINLFNNYHNTEYLGVFLRELFVRDMYSFRDIDKTYDFIKLLIPTIREFDKNGKTEYIKIYLVIFSYLLAEMINIKIKHHSIYKQIINLNYNPTSEDIDIILKFNDLKKLYFNIPQQFNEDKLKQILSPAMELYLLAIKLTDNGSKYISLSDEKKEFIVGLKNETGGHIFDSQLNILSLVVEKRLDFISKIEFLDDFINVN